MFELRTTCAERDASLKDSKQNLFGNISLLGSLKNKKDNILILDNEVQQLSQKSFGLIQSFETLKTN